MDGGDRENMDREGNFDDWTVLEYFSKKRTRRTYIMELSGRLFEGPCIVVVEIRDDFLANLLGSS